jgi:hypothetical protein
MPQCRELAHDVAVTGTSATAWQRKLVQVKWQLAGGVWMSANGREFCTLVAIFTMTSNQHFYFKNISMLKF